MARARIRLKEPVREFELDIDEESISILMPEAAIEKKRGRWGSLGECSQCGFQPWFERDISTLNYCPNCGADMRKKDD